MGKGAFFPALLMSGLTGSLWSVDTHAMDWPDSQDWAVHVDETLIDQKHGAFYSKYPDGPNSLSSQAENSYSSVAGINLGYLAGPHAEFWARVEDIRGIPLSNAGGLAALTNNDMQRVMTNQFTTYLALAFVRNTWALGGAPRSTEADEQNFARETSSRNVQLIYGKLDVLDMFDGNAYAHKSDNQFMNWCFMTSCAYDFPADARGYTWGAMSQLDWDRWSFRAGWFAMPRLPNQLELDGSVGQHFGVDAEIERRWASGALKLLAYQGRMQLSSYGQFLNQTGIFIQNSPKYDAKRGGAGLNLQQELTPGVGFFSRMFWTGGQSETMAFTEADRSVSAGFSLEGQLWGREEDGIGVGWAANSINSNRQAFLAAGNYDLFIGDGYLVYAPENVLETYYRLDVVRNVELTFDWQYIQNPAYNQVRGPVDVYGLRLHLDF